MNNMIIDGAFVHIPITPSIETAVKITRGNKTDTYLIIDNVEQNVFPFQYGDGLYTIKVYQRARGAKYALMLNNTINIKDTSKCWLYPTQLVWYNNRDIAELTNACGAKNPDNFYDYCFNKIKNSYFRAHRNKNNKNYIPDISKTIKKRKGTLFDKVSLFCALCRYNGFEAKYVTGYVKDRYHVWAEVKINNEWRIYDTKKYSKDEYVIERTC